MSRPLFTARTLEPSSPIRLGFLGLGRWGQHLYRAFAELDHCRVVAVADLEPERLECVDSEDATVRRERESDAVLLANDVDAVVIATLPDSHFELTKQALLAGKHVFVEKPMALTVSDAEALLALVRRTRLKLMVGHILMTHPALIALYRARRELGSLLWLDCERLGCALPKTRQELWWSMAPHDASVGQWFASCAPQSIAMRDSREGGVEAALEFENSMKLRIRLSSSALKKTRRIVFGGTLATAVFDDQKCGPDKVRWYESVPQYGWHEPTTPPITQQTVRFQSGMPYWNAEPLACEALQFIEALLGRATIAAHAQHGLDVVRVLAAGAQNMMTPGSASTPISPQPMTGPRDNDDRSLR